MKPLIIALLILAFGISPAQDNPKTDTVYALKSSTLDAKILENKKIMQQLQQEYQARQVIEQELMQLKMSMDTIAVPQKKEVKK